MLDQLYSVHQSDSAGGGSLALCNSAVVPAHKFFFFTRLAHQSFMSKNMSAVAGLKIPLNNPM